MLGWPEPPIPARARSGPAEVKRALMATGLGSLFRPPPSLPLPFLLPLPSHPRVPGCGRDEAFPVSPRPVRPGFPVQPG